MFASKASLLYRVSDAWANPIIKSEQLNRMSDCAARIINPKVSVCDAFYCRPGCCWARVGAVTAACLPLWQPCSYLAVLQSCSLSITVSYCWIDAGHWAPPLIGTHLPARGVRLPRIIWAREQRRGSQSKHECEWHMLRDYCRNCCNHSLLQGQKSEVCVEDEGQGALQ